MIPTLYNPSERDFASNGIGKMHGVTECKVTKERNGIFDLSMKYATNSPHYANLCEGCVIVVSHDDSGDLQPFRIQKIKREMRHATIEARHDAQMQIAGLPVWPYPSGNKTVAEVMEHLTTLSAAWSQVYPSAGIAFGTDINKSVAYSKAQARFASEFLAGKEGSLVDLLGGGELSYDWYTVRLVSALGIDKHIRISYGKNISDISGETSMGECYTGVFVYYTKDSGIKYAKAYDFTLGDSLTKYMPNYYELDITSEFQNEPQTEADFLTVANARAAAMENKQPWTNIYQNISVSWYELSQLSEYSHLPKRSVKLGDYVNVHYPAFGIDKKVEVVKTIWDPLRERYDTLELNSMKKSLHDTLTSMMQKQIRRT